MEEPLTTNQSTEALLKATVGDLLIFVNWMHLTHNAFERGDPPPPAPAPAVESERIRAWVDLIQKFEERHRRSEEKQVVLEGALQAQEDELGRLLSQLHENIATLYETLGQEAKAQETRQRASVIQTV